MAGSAASLELFQYAGMDMVACAISFCFASIDFFRAAARVAITLALAAFLIVEA